MTADWQVQEWREQETAFERLRGHAAEIRNLLQQGAPHAAFVPLLDQLEADLNTARPRHAGEASAYYEGQDNPVVTTPEGLAGRSAAVIEAENVEPAPAHEEQPKRAADEPAPSVDPLFVTPDDEQRAAERRSEGDETVPA